MSYAKKEERFWTDPELRKINYTSRYLFDWFFTNPQRHFSGVYFYEKSIISPQTGIPLKLINKSIKELEDHGFIKVCREHEVVFVINMLKHQANENTLSPTQTVGIKNHFKTLHCKCFENDFNNKYSHLFSVKDIPWKKKCEPIHTPIDTPIHTPIDTQYQSQYKYKENKTPLTPQGVSNGFDSFWQAYPKKIGKGAAQKKYGDLRRQGRLPPLQQLLAAVEMQKTWDQWQKDGGQFIPNPATWLNQGRWEDQSPEGGPQWIRELSKPQSLT